MKINYDFYVNVYQKRKKVISYIFMALFFFCILSLIYLFTFFKGTSLEKFIILSCIIVTINLIVVFFLIRLRENNFMNRTSKRLFIGVTFYETICFVIAIIISTINVLNRELPIYFFLLACILPLLFVHNYWFFSAFTFVFFIYFCIIYARFANPTSPVFFMRLLVLEMSAIGIIFGSHYIFKRAYKLEKELSQLSYTDSLTSIQNRRGLDFRVKSINNDEYLLFFDIDNFKSINDTYGHDQGDAILISFCTLLKQKYGLENCYRYGGDEIIVITDKSRKRIIDDFNEINKILSKREIKVTVSCGAVKNTDFDKDSLNDADIALYTAKKEGKKKIQFLE